MTLLHLDRSQFFQKVVKNINGREGIEYLNESSIEQSFKMLGEHKIDLILSGQELDDGTARDFLLRLEKSPYKSIPVIMVTSHDNLETRERYFNLGVVDFISKSDFDPRKLEEHLEHYRRQDEIIGAMALTSIAILDDSRLSLNLMTTVLGRYGITRVDTYTEPEDLLASGKVYDIYFVDMMLPRIPGKKVVSLIRKTNPQAVIMVISSLDKFSSIVHVLESGADDYILKPFDARFLMARLKSNFRHFQLMKKLEKLAETDSLTGIKNHRHLYDRLHDEIEKCRISGNSFSILLLDIDRFKKINDNYGHPAGDEVLKSLSRLFEQDLPENFSFGRYGGEEFLLIMPGTTGEKALAFAEERRSEFSGLSFPGLPEDVRVTFSGGLISWSDEDYPTLLKKADTLLYRAKNDGRDRITAETAN